MKAYPANLTENSWMLLLLPTLASAYRVVRVVISAVVRTVGSRGRRTLQA
jgi:hypothetical protein